MSQTPAAWHSSFAVQVTAAVGWEQVPSWQLSPMVQASPSSQPEPSDFTGFEQRLVFWSQVPGTWHWSSAKQSLFVLHGQLLVVGEQVPDSQWSPEVQVRPSLHDPPFGAGGSEQTPVAGSQVPARWHESEGLQEVVAVGEPHAPDWHVSPEVQSFASLHGVPSGCEGVEHVPVPVLQVPFWWHWSRAKQSLSEAHGQVLLAGVHTPARHWSPVVQARVSSQNAPSCFAGSEQTPVAVSQVPTS